MPSPVGHALAALALYETRRPLVADRVLLLVVVIAAWAPDLDFLPGMVTGRADRFHQGPSHSLAAAVVVGLITSLAMRRRTAGWRLGIWATLAYTSHLVMDCLAVDTNPPIGVPLGWPFWEDTVSSPFKVFRDVTRETASGWLPRGLFSMHNLKTILWETALMGAVLAVVRRGTRSRRASHRGDR